MTRVLKKDLLERANEIENTLKNEYGFEVEANPYFAYGTYGFFFDFNKSTKDMGKIRQYAVPLGTKRECLEELNRVIDRVLSRENHYKGL